MILTENRPMPKNHKQLLGVTKNTSREDAQDLKFNIYHVTYYCIQENLSKNWEIFFEKFYSPPSTLNMDFSA